MSHHQGKGDRSEVQLKKAGRAGGGAGHSRAGGGQAIPVKGGGPSPFNSAAAGAGPPQASPSVASGARPTAVAASTNRGGKRANGPSASGRGAGPPEHGVNNKLQPLVLPQHPNQQHQVVRQGGGSADLIQHSQHSQMGAPQPNADLKVTMPGRTSGNAGPGAPGVSKQPPISKPPAPPTGPSAGSEADAPSAAAPFVSQSSQNPFTFQFGSFEPSFGGVSTSGKASATPYPLRTNSAPPNLDEQKREQGRFERPFLRTPVLASGQQQNAQVGLRNVGGAVEQPPAAAMVQHLQSGVGSQGLAPVGATAQAHPPPQLGQASQYSQHPQPNSLHIPGPHMLQIAQMQQQQHQHQQHQQHALAHQHQHQQQQQQQHHHHQQQQQAVPQQQGMVQERLNQAMKYPSPPMMAGPHHNAQLLGTSIGGQLTNPLSAPPMPPMAHQLGSNMGGQIPAGMSVPYGPPPPGTQFMTQKPKSRAVKIVDPLTHEELKLDPVKKESVEPVAPSGLGSAGRVSSNGLVQARAPVGYTPQHHMAPYYFPPSATYQQPGLTKAGGFSGAPLSNSPSVRYNFTPTHPGQGVTFGHLGSGPVPPGPKVSPALGSVPPLGSAPPGPGSAEMLSTPLVAGVAVGTPSVSVPVPGFPAQAVIANPRATPPSPGMTPPIISNGRPPSLSVPPVSPPAPLTPSAVLPSPTSSIAFKFGDVEASGSAPVAAGEGSSEGSLNGANGHALAGVDSPSASVGPSPGGVVGSLPSPGASAPVMTRPSVTVLPPKQATGSSNASGVSPRVVTPPGTGGAGTFGEKVKVDAAKPTGSSNLRKNSKKDRQRQQQQQQAHPPAYQGVESDKNADQVIAAGVPSLMDKTHSSASVVAVSHKAGLPRTPSGAHGSSAVYAPVKNAGSKAEESKPGSAKAGSKPSPPDPSSENAAPEAPAGVVAAREESEFGAVQWLPGHGKEGRSLESDRSLITDPSVVISHGSTGSTGLSPLLAKDEPTEPVADERPASESVGVPVKSTPAISGLGLEPEFVEVERDTVPPDPETSKTVSVHARDVFREPEFPAAGIDEKNAEVIVPSSLRAWEAGDAAAAAATTAEGASFPVSGSEAEPPTVEATRAVTQSQESLTPVPEGREAGGGSKESVGIEASAVEESGVVSADVQASDVTEAAIVRSDPSLGALLGIPTHADSYASASEAKPFIPQEESASVLSVIGEEFPKAVEVVAAEKGSQSDSSTAAVVGQEVSSVVDSWVPLESVGVSAAVSVDREEVSVRPLEHAESTASNSYKSEANATSVVSESESDVELPSLLSSTSGISTTEVGEVVQTLESETDSVDARVVGNASAGQEGVKVGSKKRLKKELLARADAAGNTADLYNAYKVPEEKKSVEVKRAEVSGPGSSGSDARDPVATLDKSFPKEVDDWEDAAELPAPSISVVPPVDVGDRKYTRDFLITFRDQNREFPASFEIRHDIADLLLVDKDRLGFEGLPSPARNLDRQASGGGPRGDRRGGGMLQGAEEERWIRQPGPVPSPGRNQPGDARMDVSMQGGFRPGQGMQAVLITPVPQQWPGQMGQGGYPGLIQRGGPGSAPPPHFMTPGPPGRSPNGVDGERWLRQPMAGGKGPGLIPSPRTPLPAIHKAENRYEVGKVSDEEQAKQRLIKGILNKLTPQNFDKLFVQVQEANIDSATTLTGVISQIFDKALMEPTFCEMYALFCVKLAADLPEFTENDEKFTFKRVLLNKCQEEFERGEREQEEAEKVEEEHVEVKMTAEEREEKRLKARRRMLGNIRFIGELYKKSMLTERIMHECIKKLLGEYQNPDEEDVEALCKLMSTIGRIIDHPKAKEHIDAYFKRMENLSNNMRLSSRLRFMLKDCIELRRNDWQERRKVDGPKKIDEVHRDAVQERQQAARGGDRLGRGPSMGGGSSRGRMGAGSEFGMRGPPSPMYSASPMGSGPPAMNTLRRAPSPQAGVRGGGVFSQDARTEDRSLLIDARPVPMPLSQRGGDESSITLGPQGGLGRVGVRQQPLSSGRSALSDAAPMASGAEVRRLSSGPLSGIGQERSHFGGDLPLRPSSAERPRSAERALLDRQPGADRVSPGVRDSRSTPEHQRASDRSSASTAAPSTYQAQRNESTAPLVPPRPTTAPPLLSEDELRKKWESTISEYYSVADLMEAALCVEELRASNHHSDMVCAWVSESLEKKDRERDLLVKLLVHLCRHEPPLLSHDHLEKGMELVLSRFVDLVVDVPKAPEFLGFLLGRLVSVGVFTLLEVGSLLEAAGESPGEVVEEGLALPVVGAVLDTFRKEKGEEQMLSAYGSSGLDVENFVSRSERNRSAKLEVFLTTKKLQKLHPMLPVETHVRDSLDRKEPILDLVKWIETNVPSGSWDPSFLRMIMTQVLRHAVTEPLPADFSQSGAKVDTATYAPLLQKFASGKGRASSANQLQYIVAVQLFANEYGHPQGLMQKLFENFYREEVISERAYFIWQDDVNDSTPGRDKAIREVGKWLTWLAEAPEEVEDEED